MTNPDIINRKDPLTGFHTKEGLNEYLNSKLSSVYEKAKTLSVIILDLDKFKEINDTYGHLAGDDALRYFSMVINIALKGQHFVARYGGDEFVIVMYDSPDGRGSSEIAERIKTILKKEKFSTVGGVLKVHSSIGIATYPHDAKTARELIEMADQALYYAKKHGRDKVISSRRLKAHALKDKISLAVKVCLIVVFVSVSLSTYSKSESFKGFIVYYQNISYFVLYQMHRLKNRYGYSSIELKDDRTIEGWIVKEDADTLSLSITKPTLQLNPFRLDYASLIQPIRIPKSMVQYLRKPLSAAK